jgi:hypothetical protein
METNKIEDTRDFTVPYSESSYATEPTGWTKFIRTCIPFQLVRFFVLNLKIMRIVVGGHS